MLFMSPFYCKVFTLNYMARNFFSSIDWYYNCFSSQWIVLSVCSSGNLLESVVSVHTELMNIYFVWHYCLKYTDSILNQYNLKHNKGLMCFLKEV